MLGALAQRETVLASGMAVVVSNVATVVEMAIVLAAVSQPTLRLLRVPLIAAGVAAIAYGAILTIISVRRETPEKAHPGRAFSLKTALGLAGTIAVVLYLSAALNAWFGERGLLAAAAIAGFADTHSAAVSVASLVAANKVAVRDGSIPILAALTTNTASKVVVASWTGGRNFALQVIPGLVLLIAAAWMGLAFVWAH